MNIGKQIVVFGLGKVGREVVRQIQACKLPVVFAGMADSTACIVGFPLSNSQIELVWTENWLVAL